MRLPFFKKAAQPKSNELQNGLDDKNQSEDIIAVLQYLIQVLQDTQKGHIKRKKMTVAALYLIYHFIIMVLGQVVEGVAMVTRGWL